MRANRERGEHGTENAGSCSGPNGEAEFRRAEQYRIDAETFEAALKLAEQEAERLKGAISVAEAPGGWLSVLRGGGHT